MTAVKVKYSLRREGETISIEVKVGKKEDPDVALKTARAWVHHQFNHKPTKKTNKLTDLLPAKWPDLEEIYEH